MKAQAFIFARGGSKGIPRKNLKPLAGLPLIGHSIRIAKACPSLGGDVIVSTDDEEIAQTALALGASVPFRRPSELASDSASEWLAWRHAIEWARTNHGHFDIFVSLPTTSPLRSVNDVEACIDLLRQDASIDLVTTVKKADRSPWFNMVTLDSDGIAQLVNRPAQGVTRRQDAPVVYDMTTVAYVARPQFVLTHNGLFEGRMRVVEVPAERAIDIDTPFDFAIAELLAASQSSEAVPSS